jgi:hypothetical protein
MADLPPYPDTGDGTGAGPDRGSPPGMPRWVTLSGIVVGVLVLLVVITMFALGGDHGPGRHTGGGGGTTPAASVTEDAGHTPPAEHRP